jgi:hypothetical protein
MTRGGACDMSKASLESCASLTVLLVRVFTIACFDITKDP